MPSPKKFSDSYLKSNGVDAEAVRAEYGYASSVDIFNETTITLRDKSGKLVEDTGLNKDDFFKTFGFSNGESYGK